MPHLRVTLDRSDTDYLAQVRYALSFISEDVVSYTVDEAAQEIQIELKPTANEVELRARIDEILRRYDQTQFGMKTVVDYERTRDLPAIDAWFGMVERKWATPVGEGHVVLRGPAALLMALVDHKVETVFAREFGAELECFPSTIKCETLQRCNHFSSFPEHMDFVSHLRQDLQVLKTFAHRCRTQGWSPELHDGTMSLSDFAISPSCCYHAYEAMQGWDLEKPGRCITATLNCHRYEGANHQSMSRLRAFTMREVVWVGHPAFVIESRARAERLIVQWAKDWDFSCTFETANDMFFTDDYAIKASFQRQQQAKKELRLSIPSEGRSISCFSSNFHSTTFAKAFDIHVAGRPATSGCIGWGYERWVYAILSQFGFDPGKWPDGLRQDYQQFIALSSAGGLRKAATK
jgi:seryl-tRNA synthetase